MTRSRVRAFLCVVVVVMVPAPAILAPPHALVVALSATLAVAVAPARLPYRRIGLAQAASVVALVSYAVTFAYQGRHQLAGLWLPVEMGGLLLLFGRVVRRLPGRQAAVIGTALGIAAAVALPLRLTLRMPRPAAEASIIACLLSFIAVVAVAAVALYLRSLDDRRVRAVADARRAQRLETARDLHDFVAHEITGIVLEAQAAQLGALDPHEARELAVRVEEAGLRALASMDRMVSALRDPDERAAEEPPPTRVYGLADLPDLVGRFSATGRIPARLDMPGDLPPVAPEIASTAYAVVLEALTNVRRHASSATGVVVAVAPADGPALRVCVTDDDGGGASLTGLAGDDRHGGGTGLIGLAERVKGLGGVLHAGPGAAGWQVSAVLPVPEGARGRSRSRAGR
ncbi:histidine kinase [Microbispora sp. NPDC046973]|uniref:sensor histidine kinase n=1 Tax=Microbispora sp. NPDC046973 TaxID=3155022 RepID=UPI0033E722BD